MYNFKMNNTFFLALCGTLTATFTSSATSAQAEFWKVELTKVQARKLPEVMEDAHHSAFAISPSGPWGSAWGYSTEKAAELAAIQRCRERLKVGKRDCIIYVVNGNIVAKTAVLVDKIRAVYKPNLHRKRAVAFFGVSNITFQGDREAALLQLKEVKSGVDISLKYGRDSYVESLVKNKSFMMNAGGQAIWFNDGWGERHSRASTRILELRIPQWMATKEGLICMYGTHYKSTNKPIGTQCIIINNIEKGIVDFSWSWDVNAKRRAHLIAGNALVKTVR